MSGCMIDEKIRNNRSGLITVIRNLFGVNNGKTICPAKINQAVHSFHTGQRIINLPLCIFSFIKIHQSVTYNIITI